MENLSLVGLTPEQAFVEIKKVVGETPPDFIQDLVKDLAGDDGKLGQFEFHYRPGETMGSHFVAKIDTPDQQETAVRAIHDIEFLESDLGQEMRKKYGFLKYNGAVGDSCPCAACNYRRVELGVDISKDFEDGKTRTESENIVTEAYAKIGMSVPSDKNTEAGRKEFDNIKNSVKDLIKDVSRLLDRKEETLEDKAVKARAGLVKRFGEGSQEVKTFDRINSLMSKEKRTLEESIEALEKMVQLSDLKF